MDRLFILGLVIIISFIAGNDFRSYFLEDADIKYFHRAIWLQSCNIILLLWNIYCNTNKDK